MAENNYEWESQAESELAKLSHGKRVYARLLAHDKEHQYHNGESDPLATDDFLESLNSDEHAALVAYTSHINAEDAEPVTQVPTDTIGEVPPLIEQPVTEVILKTMAEDKKDLGLQYRGIDHSGIPLSKLLENYINNKARKSKKSKMDKGLYDVEMEVQRFIHFVGDIPNEELTKDIIEQKYINRRHLLPNMVHRKPQYQLGMEPKLDCVSGAPALDDAGTPKVKPVYKPVEEITKIAAGDPKAKFNTPRTINNEFTNIATFLNVMEGSGHVEKGLGKFLTKNKVDDDNESTVIPFTKEDLTLLFNNDVYEKGLLFDQPHRHWLPLISLYHGNRIAEVSMLYVDDLIQVEVQNEDTAEKVWVFLIQRNDSRDQTRKNKQSARVVPVHPALIELGLIKYRQQLVNAGEERLFPDEKSNGSKTSNWFNNSYDGNTNHGIGYAQHCGVTKHVVIDGVELKKVFHSFRKNWSTKAKRLKLDSDVRRELTGHGEGKSLDIHASVYEDNYELSEHRDQLAKVHFDIDLSRIKKWT